MSKTVKITQTTFFKALLKKTASKLVLGGKLKAR